MKRGGCKSEDGKIRGCPWPKKRGGGGGGAVVSNSVPQLKESVPPRADALDLYSDIVC